MVRDVLKDVVAAPGSFSTSESEAETELTSMVASFFSWIVEEPLCDGGEERGCVL